MSNIPEPKFECKDNRCCGVAWSEEGGSYNGIQNYPYYYNKGTCYIEIFKVTENFYKHSFYVNRRFYRFIIGTAGATLRNLKTETQTKIFIPKPGDHHDIIVITGPTEGAIINARRRIDLLIETSRSELKFTHFISIPGNTDEIKENFNKFKENVLKTCNGKVKEELFQKPEKLHLTLVMLVLLDQEDRSKAMENLEDCKNNIIIPTLGEVGPIIINFKGVEIMNDNPSQTRVLYIRAHDESGYLQSISNRIADHFIEKGLSRRQYNSVKLHMTAMNTTFLGNERWQTFDATDILKTHADMYFGTLTFSSVHISLRYSSGIDGFYRSISLIKF